MNRILTLSLVLIFLGLQTSLAQVYQGNYDLLLSVGKTSLPENVNDFIAEPSLSKWEKQSPYYYRYVQFNDMPTLSEQAAVKASGLKLLDYIPHKTYIAAFPKNYNVNALTNFNIRSIAKIDGAHKIHHLLSAEELPGWAVSGDQIDVMVMYYKNTLKTNMMSRFFSKGYKVLKLSEANNIAILRIPTSDITTVADMHFVKHIGAINPPAQKEDILGGSLQRSTSIRNQFPGGRNYTGDGVSVLCRDDGFVGPHIDFTGRITNITTDFTGTHGDGVSGIMSGAGNLDPTAVGMAPETDLYVINYASNFLDNTMSLHQNDGVMITNSSYSDGCNAGYTTGTVTVDNQIWTNQTLIHWFSAGNSNNNNCGYGAGDQWGNITGGHKIGKNVVATANLFPDGSLVASSSRGPASDGRIKPDISANGQNHVSTSLNNGYQSFGGTSGASPAAAGAAAQMYQAYRMLNSGANPKSGLIKAVMMNTAEDYGNPGPDFRYGYGRVNALRAVKVLEDARYLEDSVSQGITNTHSISVPANVSELRIMTYWMEPPGAISAAYALVNDLDMTVAEPNGTLHQPLVLNPAPNATTLNANAVEKRDSLNNVEQVVISNPMAGTYSVDVVGNIIPSGTPKYWVIYEFIMNEIVLTYPMGGEGFVPGTTERIHWDAPVVNTGSFLVEYSSDSGSTWASVGSAGSAVRHLDWNVPNITSNDVMVRVTRGNNTSQSKQLTIIDRPTNVQFSMVCLDSLTISWTAVPNATAYEVYLLGNKYMDSVGTTTNTSLTVIAPFDPAVEKWAAVAAITGDGVGLRTVAVRQGPGIVNCVVPNDLAVKILNPTGAIIDCNNSTSISTNVSVEIQNPGINPQSNFPVSYALNGGASVSQNYTATLPGGQVDTIVFSVPISVTPGTVNDLEVWSSLVNDEIKFNDTITTTFSYSSSSVVTLPYNEDFETQSSCSTASNCGVAVCPLTNGWTNVLNGQADDIDWRVDAGGTPSNNTGPSIDHNPGNSSGNYLYLEASGGCEDQTALIISPCIDLNGGSLAEASFWYHMNGIEMGELHVDVFDGNAWVEDVVPFIFGNQGNLWQKLTIDLSPFTGTIINLRIRGVTGDGFRSDMAIDDFKVVLLNQPPASDFSANKLQACVNKTITLSDESINSPNTWNWTITPNTFQFMNGTSANSQNPEVEFLANGNYDVKLTVSNINGADSLTKLNFITISDGGSIPVNEGFQAAGFPPVNWDIENPDDATTWQKRSVVGPAGSTTQATYMDNFNYNAAGEVDHLLSLPLDLQNAFSAQLTFDVAYARYSATFSDSLRIDISTDCGTTFTNGVFYKGGSDLSTVGDQTGSFLPTAASQWRNETVDLSNFIGGTLVVRFVGITGYGNQLYLDNINIDDLLSPPTASFTSGDACVSGTVFTDNSANATNHTWDFGADATPQTANTAGPHTVTFSSTGVKTIQLIVDNVNGADTLTQTVTVEDVPTAGFTFIDGLPNGGVDFTNTSTGATSYLWNFGDGTTSTQPNPSHNYSTGPGNFTVTLEATNACGTTVETMVISATNTTGIANPLTVNVFPNPNNGKFNVTIDGVNEDIEMSVIDIQGRVIKSENFGKVGAGFQTNVDLGNVAQGVYILRLRTNDHVKNVRIVKY